jgi:DNA-binding MarR family transcriptional regulator
MKQDQIDMMSLENQLCFPLYAASRELIKQYHPYLEKLGLTYTQYIVMLVFWQEKKMHVKELGHKLFLDSGTLTPVLKSLENKGLLHRYRSEMDERLVVVEITESGEALKEKTAAIPRAMMQQINLPANEAIELYRLLYKLLGREKE